MTARTMFDYIAKLEQSCTLLHHLVDTLTTQHVSQCFKLEKYCQLSGETANAIRCRRKKGVWLDGNESFLSPDGNLWIDLTEAIKWITKNYPHKNRALANAAKPSRRQKA